MSGKHQHTYVCENCGDEASLIIKEEESSLAEHNGEPAPKKGTLVCKICGSEADMILEEI
ncbi:MAG TPA: hypothetical protein DCY61_02830 [Dehalococcoidia bacterium]|nr:hypothetical protein [Dehalococcoidia bacterium]